MIYVTKQGDMWDSIAYMQMGDASYTNMLMNANTKHLSYYIFPSGIKLNIPNVTIAKTSALPPWKQVSG